MDLRERDIRYTEVMLFASLLGMLGENLSAILMKGLNITGKTPFTTEHLDKLVDVYRDKIFHYAYLPDTEKRFHAEMQAKASGMKAQLRKDLDALQRLQSLTDNDPL